MKMMNGKYSKWVVVVIVSFLVLAASMLSCTTAVHARKLLQTTGLDMSAQVVVPITLPIHIEGNAVAVLGGHA